MTTERNWAGNYTYQAASVHRPAGMDELRRIVAAAPRIHALGTRHCFNGIADSAELVSLERFAPRVEIDPVARTVRVNGAVTYGVLARELQRAGWALHNMASLPHISIAGAIATGTHGSGDASGNLATAVATLELVTSEGDVLRMGRDEERFAGMVVGLGALGVVTYLTLDIEPSYQVRQDVFLHLAWDELFERFDDVTSSAQSVSLFTDFGENVNQAWLKSRVDPEQPAPHRTRLFGAAAATRPMHPVASLSAEHSTEQLGAAGAWLDRLPHFRPDAVPASGDEVQSEYMVARQFALPAIRVLRELAPMIQPHLWIAEIRTVAGDDLWLSPAYGADTVCFHFSWRSDQDAVMGLLAILEDALAPFAPRPHWGKLFVAPAAVLEDRYERLADFRRLAETLDPRGAFRNDFLDRHVWV